jgi:integrase
MQTIINKNGTRKYKEEVRLSPTDRRTKTFTRKKDASDWKRKILMEKDRLEATGVQIDFKITFMEMSKVYLDDILLRKSKNTHAIYQATIKNHLLPTLEKLKLKDINIDDADKILLNLKRSEHNNKGINDILTVLKSIFKLAVTQGKLLVSPIQNYKLLTVKDKDFNFWNKVEFAHFLAMGAHKDYYQLYLIAGMTGLRRGELTGLCWDMVNFETDTILVRRQLKIIKGEGIVLSEDLKTKTSKRSIPMNQNVRASLLELKNSKDYLNSPYVFTEIDGISPIRIKHLYREFKMAQENTGLKFLRFHDLRHSFASSYMMQGGEIYKLSKLMGHASIVQTEKYAHLAPEHLQGATDILEIPITGEVINFNQRKKDATILPLSFQEAEVSI